MLNAGDLEAVVAATHGLTTAQTSLIAAAISLLGIIVTAALGAALGRWAEATNRRRAQYADAVAALVAWAEYPYRIRRRTSDDPAELGRLRDLGHDLQERLRSNHTWMTTENATGGNTYRKVWQLISAQTAPAAKDAWNHPPVTSAAGMNLNGWGPGDPSDVLDLLQHVIATRFGYRRVMPWLPKWRARKVQTATLTVSAGSPSPRAPQTEAHRQSSPAPNG